MFTIVAILFVLALVAALALARSAGRQMPAPVRTPVRRDGFVPLEGHKASDGFPRGTWTL